MSVSLLNDQIWFAVGLYRALFFSDTYSTINFTQDGGKTWKAYKFGTQDRFDSIAFSDNHTGWVVGEKGGIKKIELLDIFLRKTQTLKEYRQALNTIGTKDSIDVSDYITFIDKLSNEKEAIISNIKEIDGIIKKIRENNESKDNQELPDAKTIRFDAMTKMNTQTFVTSTITRIGVVSFIVYFIGVLNNLYRYSMRLSAFYEGRADVLEIKEPDGTEFSVLIDNFSPDQINFGKPPSEPGSQAIDLTKELLKIKPKSKLI